MIDGEPNMADAIEAVAKFAQSCLDSRDDEIAKLKAQVKALTAERDAQAEVIRRNQHSADSIVELCKRITSGNAVHHARNIGTMAGAIANRIARAAVEKGGAS